MAGRPKSDAPPVNRQAEVDAIVRRAVECRVSFTKLAEQAGINPVTFARGRSKGRIGLAALDKLERKLTEIEAERATA